MTGKKLYSPGRESMDGFKYQNLWRITSRNNPRVKTLLNEIDSLFVFEGKKLVLDLIRKGAEISKLIISAGVESELDDIQCSPEEIWVVSDPVMRKISRFKNAPDYMAVVRLGRKKINFEKSRTIVILDNIQDPANGGTAFRCAAAFGTDAVAMTGKSVHFNNPKFIRTAQTALLDVNFQAFASLDVLFKKARINQFNIYFTSSDPGIKTITPKKIQFPCMVVVGNEGQGVESRWLQTYPVVHIPQTRAVESLNAGVSACLLMYEIQELIKRG